MESFSHAHPCSSGEGGNLSLLALGCDLDCNYVYSLAVDIVCFSLGCLKIGMKRNSGILKLGNAFVRV